VCLSLLLAGVTWLSLLPQTPFEGDEARFLDGIRDYDVARHAPHPPGYPVYVALSAVMALMAGPVHGTQLASILGALLTLLTTGLVLHRLGASRGQVLLCGLLLVGIPAFAFYANVGLSDCLGAGVAACSLWTLVRAIERPDHRWRLQMAAASVALTIGVRPQLLFMVAGVGLWALLGALTARCWRQLLEALVAGILVSLTCWVPAVLLTGWDSYLRALRHQSVWMVSVEAHRRLPGAPLDSIIGHWFVYPFGTELLAAGFWLLVVAGAIVCWQTGRRRLVAIAIASAGVYMLTALWTLNYLTTTRYILPALPMLAALASGVVLVRRPWLGRLLASLLVTLVVLQVAWAAPAHLLRVRQPAPVWDALTWVADHADPATTHVVLHKSQRPHGRHLLETTGIPFTMSKEPEKVQVAAAEVWEVVPRRLLTGTGDREELYSTAWDCKPLRRLTRNRYNDCVVLRRRH
jgi:4-amino-4-deoxy-L-arabinose transferase-like glycosyltransferase